MLRFRRYRIFLAVAIFCLVGLYYLNDTSSWGNAISASSLKNFGTKHRGSALSYGDTASAAADPGQLVKGSTSDPDIPRSVKQPQQNDARPKEDFPQIKLPGEDEERDSHAAVGTSSTSIDSISSIAATTKAATPTKAESESALAVSAPTSTSSKLHWAKQVQFFPVPTESVIPLPSGRSARIPRVQARFPQETVSDRRARQEKLGEIKDTFLKHWRGYKQFAWEHDELKPVTGTFRDPFAGWRATLVDTLDTLWIMGLKEEFEEAAEAVGNIDFTTTERTTIPMFEVAIRYMGGLLAAYDISEHRYPVLLEKVVELGELLMSAFDTPNRMPVTHFNWEPASQAKPRVSSSGVVLAEIGSLSVEFARLAQVTGNARYYDAIARITNEFEAWQNNTKLPGLFPLWIDASGGCVQSEVVKAHSALNGPIPDSTTTSPSLGEVDAAPTDREDASLLQEKDKNTFGTDRIDVKKEDSKASRNRPIAQKDESTFGTDRVDEKRRKPQGSREVRTEGTKTPEELNSLRKRQADKPRDECVTGGFRTQFSSDKFTLGGMADSVYEYLPKAYLVLGGRNKQYRQMHETAMNAAREHLLYSAMIPERDRHLIFSGSASTDGSINQATGQPNGFFQPETGHLECFSGAMFGLGGRIFDRPDDVEIGERMTDGCIWAYEQMATGIMPENFSPVPCEDSYDKPCAWNESKWWDAIDPNAAANVAANAQNAADQRAKAVGTSADMGTPLDGGPSPPRPHNRRSEDLDKRQLNDDDIHPALNTIPNNANRGGGSGRGRTLADLAGQNSVKDKSPDSHDWTDASSRTPTSRPAANDDLPEPGPTDIPTYMRTRIRDMRLKPGISHIGGRNYMLRPEAIESVFYSYRITGKSYYRDKGWAMFRAIAAATAAPHGNSAVDDVTSRAPRLDDTAESFWLGETLKYFYLLFDEEEGEGALSLDDWVFSTEAHPFRRGDKDVDGGYYGDARSRKIAADMLERIEGHMDGSGWSKVDIATGKGKDESRKSSFADDVGEQSSKKEAGAKGRSASSLKETTAKAKDAAADGDDVYRSTTSSSRKNGAGVKDNTSSAKDVEPKNPSRQKATEETAEKERPHAGTAAGSGAGRSAEKERERESMGKARDGVED